MPTTSILSENSEKEISVLSKSAVFNKEFTVYGTAENPLFLAKDVAIMIDYDWGSINKMLRNLDDDEKVKKHYTSLGSEDFGTSKKFNFGTNEAWFITENGVYELMFLVKTPIAKQFKKQVKKILHDLRTNATVVVDNSAIEKELALRERECNEHAAVLLAKLSEKYKEYPKYSQALDAESAKMLCGRYVLPLPPNEKEAQYTATQIAEELGITKNKVGIIANKNNLKVNEYGEKVITIDKNGAQRPSFIYNKKGFEKISQLVKKGA